MKKPSFAAMFKQFSNVWIAYDAKTNKVYGTGRSLAAALNRARKNGLTVPAVTKAPKKHLPWII